MKSKYFSEFLGTAFLFCTVVGSGIMGQNLSSNDSLTLLANTLATVFAPLFSDYHLWRSQLTLQSGGIHGHAGKERDFNSGVHRFYYSPDFRSYPWSGACQLYF